jgi:pantetheine-phosphate adenylyltransferase
MRAAQLFDKVIMGVAANPSKQPLFTSAERVALIAENITHLPNVSVTAFEGLTVDFAKQLGAVVVVRGLRAVSDFEHEFQMAQMNRHLDSGLETVFLMPNRAYFYTSSTLVKQVARFTQDDLKPFAPDNVLSALKERLK